MEEKVGKMNEERAKHLLVHYFNVVARHAGFKWDGDNVAEIEDIVEYIVAAAVERQAGEIARLKQRIVDLEYATGNVVE